MEEDKAVISYYYCGGTYPLLMFLAVVIEIASIIAQLVLIVSMINGSVPILLAVLMIVFLSLLSIGAVVLFIIMLIKHIHNISTWFEIYKNKIVGKGLYRSPKLNRRKYDFSVLINDITDINLSNNRLVINTKNEEKISVLVNTRDFKRRLNNVLYYNK